MNIKCQDTVVHVRVGMWNVFMAVRDGWKFSVKAAAQNEEPSMLENRVCADSVLLC